MPSPIQAIDGNATQALGRGPFAVVANASSAKNHRESDRITQADLKGSDLTGLQIGAYDLGPRIGGGGMGQVFRAVHRHLQREVAIKFVGCETPLHGELEARFLEETRAVGQLQHRHIVQASDAGVIHGVRYLVTELLQGNDLTALVAERRRLPLPVATEIVRQAALGLDHAHRMGFVHRDIKPSNLFCTTDGQVKVLDFGLVRNQYATSELTTLGTFMGTMDYIAPEQAENATLATPSSDIYSLGCTLIFLLTSQPPFPDDAYPTPVMKLRGHLADAPTWLTRLEQPLPASVVSIVSRMMEKDPTKRYASCAELADALTAFSSERGLQRWLLEPSSLLREQLTPTNVHTTSTSQKSPQGAKSKVTRWILAIVGILIVVGSISLGLQKKPLDPTPSAESPAASAATSDPRSNESPSSAPVRSISIPGVETPSVQAPWKSQKLNKKKVE